MITIELVYDAPGPRRRTTKLDLPDGSTVRDAMRMARGMGFEIGYVQVWLDMEPLNDQSTDLDRLLQPESVLHIKMVDRWMLD